MLSIIEFEEDEELDVELEVNVWPQNSALDISDTVKKKKMEKMCHILYYALQNDRKREIFGIRKIIVYWRLLWEIPGWIKVAWIL